MVLLPYAVLSVLVPLAFLPFVYAIAILAVMEQGATRGPSPQHQSYSANSPTLSAPVSSSLRVSGRRGSLRRRGHGLGVSVSGFQSAPRLELEPRKLPPGPW